MWAIAQMPHQWKYSTAIDPHLHWIQTNSDQTNMWYIYYRAYDIGDVVSAWTYTGVAATNTVAYSSGSLHQLSCFPDVTMTGIGLSGIVDFKVMRDGGSGTGTVLLKELDVHYEIDKLGSANEVSN